MLASLILVFTLGCISWSLWVRRVTWRCRYEVAITITLVLQGIGLILTSSFASATLGLVLQRAVGRFNFEDFIAHSVNIVSLCLIAVSVAGRLRSAAGDGALRRQFKICVEYPVALSIPILLLLFWHAPGAAHTYWVDFRAVSTETWLTAYWVVLCLLQGWLISYICWLLLALRRDPRSTKTASVYLVALMMGAVALMVRIVTAAILGLDGPMVSLAITVPWRLYNIMLAFAAVYGWRQVLRQPRQPKPRARI